MICFTHYRGFYTLRKWLHYFSAFVFKTIVALIVVLCISSLCHGQSTEITSDSGEDEIRPLRVGEKVPEDFWTREHLFYADGDTIRKSLEEYKGKLLVLDFWATWCGSCKVWFPNNIQLQREYGNDIKILLVNSDTLHDDLIKIEEVLSDRRYFEDKNGQSIIYDSYLKNLFPYFSIPLYIWIDSREIIRAITTFDFVSSSQIKTLLNRKQFNREKGDKDE